MPEKIIVEFDREDLDDLCVKHCQWYKLCSQTNIDMIKCALRYMIDFKIKDKYKIETKFKENDLIWLIDYDSENGIWFVSGSFYIWKILIQVVSGNIDIQYGLLKDNNYYWYMKEQNCFLTKEEAQKECERRNNGK